MQYLLGIDHGTGGAKACLINDQATVVSYAYQEYPILVNNPGWSEHDPTLYWPITCKLIRQCTSAAGVQPEEIVAIGTSSALPSLVMVDKEGNPIANAYNLMDKRAQKEEKWLRDKIGEREIFELTGNRLEDHPSIVNLLWEKENRPENYARINKVLTIDGYIRFKLCGRYTESYSCATFLGAYDIRRNQFDRKLLEKIGLNPDWFPEVFSCETVIGTVSKEAAAQAGLSCKTLVCAGQCDFNAGCIGCGISREGQINMNLGTCGNFGVIHKDPTFMDSMLACAFTVDSEKTYITIPTTTTGGQSLRYLRDNFCPIEVETERMTGLSSYALMDAEAERIPVGSEGLVILPYLMGERTPLWDNDARGIIFGLSLHHTKAHVIRAMMEGVAYALYHSFCLIQESGKKVMYPIVLNEGGAKSQIWRRIITDVFNVPTVAVKSRVGAPLGDAILAGVSAGIFNDYGVAEKNTEYLERMEPIAENHKKYMQYYKLFLNLYDHVKQDYKALSEILKNMGEKQ